MPCKILVVDDEPDLEVLMRQRFRKQIRNGEYLFSFASNGEEALRCLAEDESFEVLLTDLNMPVMDGLAFLEQVNRLATFHQRVVVSANGDLTRIREAMNRGAFDFLTKPIDFVDLETTIHKAIDQVRFIKESSQAHKEVADFRHEMGLAHTIQQSILTQNFDDIAGVEIAARMIPARNVGGDFYDAFTLADGRVGVVIGDVSGKGTGAAIFMAVCRSLLRSIANQGRSAGDTLREANRLICEDNRTDLFVTLFYGVLEPETGRFEYASGGHNSPYRFTRAGAVSLLDTSGMEGSIIGAIPRLQYSTARIWLEPEEGLLLYTDGVTEARSRALGMYREQGLERFLARSCAGSAQEVVARLVDDVGEFTNGAPQSDDITVLVLRQLGRQ